MRGKNISFLILSLIITLAAGCTTLKRRGQSGPSPRTDITFDEPQEEPSVQPKIGEPLKEIKGPPKFGVILGPGGLKTMAHAGVIKELVRARVPIEVVIGLEWGALPAGLFSLKGEANNIEWQLYKLEQKGWPRSGWLNSRHGPVAASGFNDFFSEAFASNILSRSKIKFACPARRLSSGRVTWYRSGEFRKILASCVRFPPLNKFEMGDGVVAAPGALSEAASLARELGAEKLIFINVLGPGQIDLESLTDGKSEDAAFQRVLWAQIGEQIHQSQHLFDDWIDVNTKSINVFSLAHRKELQSRGEAAGQSAVRNLTDKYGL